MKRGENICPETDGIVIICIEQDPASGQALNLASARQAPSKVVLPHPAGATMRASWLFIAAYNRCNSRGRVTTFMRRGGTVIFVMSRWRDGMLMVEERAGVAGI